LLVYERERSAILLKTFREVFSRRESELVDSRRSSKNITIALMVSSVVFLGMAAVQSTSASGVYSIAWAASLSAIICVATLAMVRVTGVVRPAAHVLSATLFLFTGAIAVASSGRAIGALFFLSLVPAVSIQTLGLRAAAVWALMTTSLLVWLFKMRLADALPIIQINPDITGASPNRAALIFSVVLFFVLALSEIARTSALRRVSRSEHEQSRLDQALSRESERARALVENSGDFIIELDADGRIEFASENGADVIGSSDLLGKNFFDLLWSSEPGARFEMLAKLSLDELVVNKPIRFSGDDGFARWIEVSGREYLPEKDERKFVFRLRDVTPEVELQRRLLQTQKLEAVGRLAGGVAHDFNNLLTIFIGCAEEILEDPKGSSEAAREIIRNAEHGAGLTRQLLTFTRESAYSPYVVDLSAVVRDLRKMLERLLAGNADLRLDLVDSLPLVEVDPQLAEQAIINLVCNARDAISDGAFVEVTTDKSVDQYGEQEVILKVIDNGSGMSPEVAERAFDPFFTTKEVGRGTGLGLAAVRDAVEQMGGRVALDTREGHGTTVTLHFPSTHKTANVPGKLEGEPADLAPITGKILVVEDESTILEMVRASLSGAGFDVMTAPDAEHALSIFERANCSIDLIVSDVVMPGISGPEMMVQIREAQPNAKVLFMSGYIGTEPGKGPLPDDPLLRKPFRGYELVDRVRLMLGEMSS
jgi:PAS domain S-box-containing protein